MTAAWEFIKHYYITLGKSYDVNPIIFLSIHIVATPLFILSVAWFVKNYKQKKEILIPLIVGIIIFNAANIYLVTFGKNIPWYIYALLGLTTFVSGYITILRISKQTKTK